MFVLRRCRSKFSSLEYFAFRGHIIIGSRQFSVVKEKGQGKDQKKGPGQRQGPGPGHAQGQGQRQVMETCKGKHNKVKASTDKGKGKGKKDKGKDKKGKGKDMGGKEQK